MCLGIPGKVIETWQEQDLQMGRVDFGGVFKRVCLEHTPEALPGKYVIVHVGFALQVIDEDEARQVFEFLRQMGDLAELGAELEPDVEPPSAPAGTASEAKIGPP